MSTEVVRSRNGKFYIVHSDTMFSEPVRISNWWPTGIEKTSATEHLEGQQAEYRGDGWYYIQGVGQKLCLPDGGETKAEFVEEEPVLCPKVSKNIETEYRNGQWWKYLKSKGWVRA